MDLSAIEALGSALAKNRKHGLVSGLPLNRIASEEEAEAVQTAAIEAYGGALCGYTLIATSQLSQRLLNCDEPVFGPLLDSDLLPDGTELRLPYGVIGAGCGFAFVVGRPYPEEGEDITLATAAQALVSCLPTIGVLGRRVPGSVPLNSWAAAADFALNVAYVRGHSIAHWRDLDIAATRVKARINGEIVGSGCGADVMGHPAAVVAWLARTLLSRDRERQLVPGETIMTGSCTGILQVLPGQAFEADFGELGTVKITLA